MGLLVDIVLKKYLAHRPPYCQKMILRIAHGIELSRKTMSDWGEKSGGVGSYSLFLAAKNRAKVAKSAEVLL